MQSGTGAAGPAPLVLVCDDTEPIRRLLRMRPDPRASHHDLLLLFAAHYLREARLERLWIRALSDDTEPDTVDDVTARWFWPGWLRILEQKQIETP